MCAGPGDKEGRDGGLNEGFKYLLFSHPSSQLHEIDPLDEWEERSGVKSINANLCFAW